MQPRLKLDIGWRDLASIWPPVSAGRVALENALALHAPAGSVPVVGLSVRSLFLALLEEAGQGRPVAMSAVTVEDMASLVLASGSSVVPVDIELDTLLPDPAAMRQACGEDVGMIVIAHLYGTRGPIEPILAGYAKPGRLIVEDCAQAFDGRLRLSPGADVALYSFGPIKTATALGGAIALFRDPELARRVRERIAHWPACEERWFLRRAAKFGLLKLLSMPWLYRLFLSVVTRVFGDPDRMIGSLARSFSGRPIVEAVRHAPPRRLLRLLERRLNSWQANDGATAAMLERLAQSVLVPGLVARPSHWWLAPVLVARPDALVATLRKQGFDATRGATSMRALAGSGANAPRTAGRLIGSVVYLPKPADDAAAVRLARTVEHALREQEHVNEP